VGRNCRTFLLTSWFWQVTRIGGTKGVVWARKRFRETPVLYVAGNHEFYNERIGRLHEKLREAAAGSNVIILENDTLELDGFRFFGATLWTDFNLFGDRHSAMAAAGDRYTGMNDYRKIRQQDVTKLKPMHTALIHADTLIALTKFLTTGDRARSIVITHHAPSLQSLPARKHTETISAAYASNLNELIETQGPALWIHGHLHFPQEYIIGSTRIVNNAPGYPRKVKPEQNRFKPDLVIEL